MARVARVRPSNAQEYMTGDARDLRPSLAAEADDHQSGWDPNSIKALKEAVAEVYRVLRRNQHQTETVRVAQPTTELRNRAEPEERPENEMAQ